MARRARITRPAPMTEETIEIDPMDPLEQAQDEVDAETGEIDKLKGLIRKLQSDSPDEDLTISVRTRISEWKPWSILSEASRKVAVKDFDIEHIIADIQSSYGDGNYKLVIYYRGHAFKHYDFYVGDPRNPKKVVAEQSSSDKADLFTLLPALLNSSRDSTNQMMQMIMLMMQQSRESSDRSMQAQMQMMGLLIPAISGGKTDPTEIMARFATMYKEMQPPAQASGGMGEMLDNAVKIKELIGGGSSGKETNVFDIIKDAAPAVAAALTPLLAGPGATNVPQITAQGQRPATTRLPAVPYAPMQPAPIAQPTPLSAPSFDDPILNLIGEDVLFFAKRNYPADIAADTITDRLDNAGINLEQLQAHFAEWIAGGDWLEALAAKGLDLREYREWATEVITGVVERLSAERELDAEEAAHGSARQGGSESNNADHGGTIEGRVTQSVS